MEVAAKFQKIEIKFVALVNIVIKYLFLFDYLFLNHTKQSSEPGHGWMPFLYCTHLMLRLFFLVGCMSCLLLSVWQH